MKIAVLGKGKTGSEVIELLKLQKPVVPMTIFDSQNVPTLQKLKGHDVIISFLPGEAFTNLIPTLVDSKIPVVCGSTGFEWPRTLNFKLKDQRIRWIYSSNFSLGMNLVQQMIFTLNRAQKVFSEYSFNIHEVHHTKKLDAPSGTALSWKKWLNLPCEITHERSGDVIGFHELTLNTPFETIKLSHDAKSRKIFAEGAIYAAKKLASDPTIPYGLNSFQEIISQELKFK